MKKTILSLLIALGWAGALAQIPAPQIGLSGNVGTQGFPLLNSGTIILASDANHTMSAQETSAFSFKVTSSVSLTATRNLIFPAGKFPLGCVENATTGGQSIQVISTSGTGVPIASGTTVCGLWNDGTNFVTGPTGGGGGSGISGGTAGQAAIFGSPTTITSGIPINGTGAGLVTGPASAGSSDLAVFSSSAGAIADSSLLLGSVVTVNGTQTITNKTSYNGVPLTTSGPSTNFLNESGTYTVPAGGGGGGFPIVLGTTSIASGSTTTALTGLSVNGVTLSNGGATTTFLNGAGAYTTPAGGGGSVATSANVLTTNSQVQVDSIASSTDFGMTTLGDSITAGTGVTPSSLDYVSLMGADYGLTPTNDAIVGNSAADVAWSVLNLLNPAESGNPIITSMIGTNNVNFEGVTGLPSFTQEQYLSATFTATSSNNKILAGNSAVTQSGTWTADTTFPMANGLVSSTAGNTLTYAAQIGPSGVFYTLFRMSASGGSFTISVGGSLCTDTVLGSSTITTAWTEAPRNHATTGGAARCFNAAWKSTAQTIVVTVASGTVPILGFVFPPETRYRGASAPKYFMAGVPPEQNNTNGTITSQYNAVSLAVSQQLVADGLYVPFVDVLGQLDPNLDWTSTTTQNCVASTSSPLHPGTCGHRHLSQVFESVINAAMPGEQPNLTSPLNYSAIPTSTVLSATLNNGGLGSFPTGLTNFAPTTNCLLVQGGFPFCDFVQNPATQFHFMRIASGTAGATTRISFGFVSADNITPTLALAAESTWWQQDGSAQIVPGFAITSTATGNQIKDVYPSAAVSVSQYSLFAPASSPTTALIQGISLDSGSEPGGVHFLNAPLSTGNILGPGFFANSVESITNCFYTGPASSITTPSQFTCPDWVTSGGIHFANGFNGALNGTVGATTPAAGAFTALNATSIGATTPGTGAFTTVAASGAISGLSVTATNNLNGGGLIDSGAAEITGNANVGSFSIGGIAPANQILVGSGTLYTPTTAINPASIGATTPGSGIFTTLTATGALSSVSGALNGTIGATVPNTGAFSTVTDAGLTGGNCVQAGTGGLLTTTGAACPVPLRTTASVTIPISAAGICTSQLVTLTGLTSTMVITGSPSSTGSVSISASFIFSFSSTNTLQIQSCPILATTTSQTLNFNILAQ
jgi:hypothetical protein